MPKEKELTQLIPRIYKQNAENLGLFFFVSAQRQVVPTITLMQSIANYFRFCDIESWDYESALATFAKLQKDYLMDCKNEIPETIS